MTNTITNTLEKLFKYQLFFRTLKTVCVIIETSLQYVKAITLKVECVTLSMYKKLKLHAQKHVQIQTRNRFKRSMLWTS